MKYLQLILVLFVLSACKNESKAPTTVDFYDSDLFKAIQLDGIFEDSKTVVDLIPKESYSSLIARYNLEKEQAGFNLEAFVTQYFTVPVAADQIFVPDTTRTMYEHISSMWPALTRGADVEVPYSSRINLPKPYVVPGGRFQEIYYWDSYFTMEGLLADGQDQLATDMVDNFSYLIKTIGHIPNGTRNYYLSRSQPPFFTPMVAALAESNKDLWKKYLPAIEQEYQFWMDGITSIEKPNTALKQVIKVSDSIYLNRYWDRRNDPRQESYKEDFELAEELNSETEKQALYANLRAGAASGWDFSSRWYAKKGDFSSTNTTALAAIDLNCLLYFMEVSLAKAYAMEENEAKQALYTDKAIQRKWALQTYFWDDEQQFFMDYDFAHKKTTSELTLAAAFPLFFEIATPKQAEGVKQKIMSLFLKDGGLVTTLNHSGQQWDAPNGWAPLQWISVKGLLNYGYTEEAKIIMERWLALNQRVYKNTGKMVEKYNVEDITLLSGGGEYETQDGFGWTNGVALGFKALLENLNE